MFTMDHIIKLLANVVSFKRSCSHTELLLANSTFKFIVCFEMEQSDINLGSEIPRCLIKPNLKDSQKSTHSLTLPLNLDEQHLLLLQIDFLISISLQLLSLINILDALITPLQYP